MTDTMDALSTLDSAWRRSFRNVGARLKAAAAQMRRGLQSTNNPLDVGKRTCVHPGCLRSVSLSLAHGWLCDYHYRTAAGRPRLVTLGDVRTGGVA